MSCTCGQTPCQCYTAPAPVPCYTCTETSVCKIKVPAECVTINNTDLKTFFECGNILDYLYNCLVNNPTQYERFCALWADCA